MFDYSGFGKSKGSPSEKTCYKNGSDCVNYLLRNGYSEENIVLYGESIGCPIASYLANNYNIKNIILQAGPAGIKFICETILPSWLQWIKILFDDLNTFEYLKNYKKNNSDSHVMIIHSESDEIVPYNQGLMMRPFCDRFIKSSGTHNNMIIPWKKIKEFLDLHQWKFKMVYFEKNI